MSTTGKMKRKAIFRSLRPEFFIMMAIICAVCYQLAIESMISNEGALTIDEHGRFIVIYDDDLADQYMKDGRALARFNPELCRIIAVYDENMESIWQLSFVEHPDIFYDDSIYPDEVKNGTSEEGNFEFITYTGDPVRVTYRWRVSPRGSRYLIVFSTSLRKEQLHQNQVIVAYSIIILSFVMLANVLYWQIHGITNRYKKMILEQYRSTGI